MEHFAQELIGKECTVHYCFSQYHSDDPLCTEDIYSYKAVVVKQVGNDQIAIQNIEDQDQPLLWFKLENKNWVSKKPYSEDFCQIVLTLPR